MQSISKNVDKNEEGTKDFTQFSHADIAIILLYFNFRSLPYERLNLDITKKLGSLASYAFEDHIIYKIPYETTRQLFNHPHVFT